MDGAEMELVCLCGFENFERIVVRRLPHDPIVTDFVACVGCRAMYFAPMSRPDPQPRKPGDSMGAIGGPEPQPDSAAALKRDAADAARDYKKPGRSNQRSKRHSRGGRPGMTSTTSWGDASSKPKGASD